jgi:hypothetical protein
MRGLRGRTREQTTSCRRAGWRRYGVGSRSLRWASCAWRAARGVPAWQPGSAEATQGDSPRWLRLAGRCHLHRRVRPRVFVPARGPGQGAAAWVVIRACGDRVL